MSNDKYNRRSDDFIAIPLTSNMNVKDYTMLITNSQLESGRLVVDSKAKVDRVFSISQSLVRMKVGRLKIESHEKLIEILLRLVRAKS